MTVSEGLQRWVMAFDRFVLPREKYGKTAITLPSFPSLPSNVVDDTPASIRQTFTEIDAKASSVLTHISIMLAGLFFLFGFGEPSKIETAFLGFELLGYLTAALFLIRCLLHFEFYKSARFDSESDKRKDWFSAVTRESSVRITYLNHAITITFYLTALLAIAVTIDVVLSLSGART